IPEDTEIVSDAHALIAAKIYVDCGVLAVHLAVVDSCDNHRHALAVNRREMIEGGSVLKGWTGAFHVGPHDIATFHIATRKIYLSAGNVGLHINDANLPGVGIQLAHGFDQFLLPFEPLHVKRVTSGADHGKAIADLNAFIAAAVDVYVIAASEGNLEVGLFAGDDTDVGGDVIRNESGTVHGRIVGRIRG